MGPFLKYSFLTYKGSRIVHPKLYYWTSHSILIQLWFLIPSLFSQNVVFRAPASELLVLSVAVLQIILTLCSLNQQFLYHTEPRSEIWKHLSLIIGGWLMHVAIGRWPRPHAM